MVVDLLGKLLARGQKPDALDRSGAHGPSEQLKQLRGPPQRRRVLEEVDALNKLVVLLQVVGGRRSCVWDGGETLEVAEDTGVQV
jgi:hypothetical protein